MLFLFFHTSDSVFSFYQLGVRNIKVHIIFFISVIPKLSKVLWILCNLVKRYPNTVYEWKIASCIRKAKWTADGFNRRAFSLFSEWNHAISKFAYIAWFILRKMLDNFQSNTNVFYWPFRWKVPENKLWIKLRAYLQ